MPDAPLASAPETPDRVALYPRYDETFPTLTADEIDRLRRFGERAPLPRTARRSSWPASRRRACSSSSPASWRSPSATASAAASRWSSRARASSSPRSAPCPAARRWSTAPPRARSTAILIPPAGLRALLVAEATLGERITRALILRRVQIIQAGAGRAADHRRPRQRRRAAARDLPAPGRAAAQDRRPRRRSGRRAASSATAAPDGTVLPVVITPLGDALLNPSIADLGRALGPDRPRAGPRALRRGGGRRRPGRPLGRRLCRLRGAVGGRARCPRLRRAGRGQRPHRELPRLSHRHHRRRR